VCSHTFKASINSAVAQFRGVYGPGITYSLPFESFILVKHSGTLKAGTSIKIRNWLGVLEDLSKKEKADRVAA
jgi:hypothetical protein